MQLPSAIIFINTDLNDVTINTLKLQLELHDVINHAEFVSRVEVDPSYPDIIHNTQTRLLVLLDNFRNYEARELADIVIFFACGLLNIEKNKFGPPKKSIPLENINIYNLLFLNGNSAFVPGPHTDSPITITYKVDEDGNIINGIYTKRSFTDPSGVYDPNPDNIYNNEDFLKRKM